MVHRSEIGREQQAVAFDTLSGVGRYEVSWYNSGTLGARLVQWSASDRDACPGPGTHLQLFQTLSRARHIDLKKVHQRESSS